MHIPSLAYIIISSFEIIIAFDKWNEDQFLLVSDEFSFKKWLPTKGFLGAKVQSGS